MPAQRNSNGISRCTEPGCDYRCSSRTSLASHMATKHNGQKARCDECQAEFADRTNLNRHKKTMHRNADTYWCTRCQKSIGNRADNAKRHESSRNGACKDCVVHCPKELEQQACAMVREQGVEAAAAWLVNAHAEQPAQRSPVAATTGDLQTIAAAAAAAAAAGVEQQQEQVQFEDIGLQQVHMPAPNPFASEVLPEYPMFRMDMDACFQQVPVQDEWAYSYAQESSPELMFSGVMGSDSTDDFWGSADPADVAYDPALQQYQQQQQDQWQFEPLIDPRLYDAGTVAGAGANANANACFADAGANANAYAAPVSYFHWPYNNMYARQFEHA